MAYSINLTKHNVSVGNRIIILNNKDRTIYKKITIRNPDIIVIKYFDVIKDIHNFKYKFQEYKDNKWKDITSYFPFINHTNLDQFLLDKVDIKEVEIENLINYFSKPKLNGAYIKFIKLFRSITESLWLNHNSNHRNLSHFIKLIKQLDLELTLLWKNVIIYWEHVLKLKKIYSEKNYNNLYWDDIRLKINNDKEIKHFLEDEISALEKKDLQFSDILVAQYYSILGNREKAEEYFVSAAEPNNNWEFDFLIGQGASTYKKTIDLSSFHEPELHLLENYEANNSKLTMIVSMDEFFLRNYGTQLLTNIIALKKYHLHIHLVTRDMTSAVKTLVDTQNLFESIVKYTNKKSEIISPTFTYESVNKDVENIKTYSACARYIHSYYFMNKFGKDILILDADMFLTDDLSSYINFISKYDIGLAFSKGITSMVPWRRVMAGNVYVKNLDKNKSFLLNTRNYILSNIYNHNTWTLDQNALTYSYEKSIESQDNISFFNIYKVKKPFSHPPIRKYMEQL